MTTRGRTTSDDDRDQHLENPGHRRRRATRHQHLHQQPRRHHRAPLRHLRLDPATGRRSTWRLHPRPLDIDNAAFSSWYRITGDHQLEPLTIDQLTAALTTELLHDITTQTTD